MPSDRVTVGLSLDCDTIDALEDIADELAERDGGAPSRSEAARETLPLGIAVYRAFDSQLGRGLQDMAPQERRALARQAVLDALREIDE